MIPNIDRRLKKIESQLHLEQTDLSQWSDAELEGYIVRELERMIAEVGSLEAVAEAYRIEGLHSDADFILRDYLYDPTSKTVSRKSALED
jgi:CCR4-NOT transcriptional regulation complex NOT5 subunit